MDDRQKRRVHLSEIGIKSTTEKIGTVFSPFHSLELSVSQQLILYSGLSAAMDQQKDSSVSPTSTSQNQYHFQYFWGEFRKK